MTVSETSAGRGASDGPDVGADSGPGRLMPDAMVHKTIQLVDQMGVLDRIQSWRDAERRGPGGRPETFPMRALLVAMVLCVTTDQPLLVTTVCDVLFVQITPAMRAALGVPAAPGPLDHKGRAACYRNVRSRLHTLLDLMDPSELPKNRRLDPAAFEAAVALRIAIRSQADREVRRERLTWFINQILKVSFDMVPHELRGQWQGSVAVDATVVPAFARPESRKWGRDKTGFLRSSADPDAAWYHRDPDGRDADVAAAKKSVWGYELTIAVTANDDPNTEPDIPSLVVGMAPLHRPSVAPGPNAIVALASIEERGHPTGWLAGDRAYTNQKPQHFQLPARALGYRLVLDYKSTQLGVQDSFGGMVQVEGGWYCPSMPDALIHAERDFRNGVIDRDTYQARLEERWRYRILPRGLPDAEGHTRMRCPAANPSPVLRCDLKPRSVRLETWGKARVLVLRDVRDAPPTICTQESITVPPDAGAKLGQDLLHNSDEWWAHYSTSRNSIEGFNGFVKDGAHEALDDPERRRVHGVAAQTVFVAFLILAANLRKIVSFLAEKAAIEAGRVRRLPRRRRTPSIETWRPEGTVLEKASGPDPPLTA